MSAWRSAETGTASFAKSARFSVSGRESMTAGFRPLRRRPGCEPPGGPRSRRAQLLDDPVRRRRRQPEVAHDRRRLVREAAEVAHQRGELPQEAGKPRDRALEVGAPLGGGLRGGVALDDEVGHVLLLARERRQHSSESLASFASVRLCLASVARTLSVSRKAGFGAMDDPVQLGAVAAQGLSRAPR